jgi:hypothetical protein
MELICDRILLPIDPLLANSNESNLLDLVLRQCARLPIVVPSHALAAGPTSQGAPCGIISVRSNAAETAPMSVQPQYSAAIPLPDPESVHLGSADLPFSGDVFDLPGVEILGSNIGTESASSQLHQTTGNHDKRPPFGLLALNRQVKSLRFDEDRATSSHISKVVNQTEADSFASHQFQQLCLSYNRPAESILRLPFSAEMTADVAADGFSNVPNAPVLFHLSNQFAGFETSAPSVFVSNLNLIDSNNMPAKQGQLATLLLFIFSISL